MAVRSPRRSFAAPFVIVSLAACHHEAPREPIHDNPPAPQDHGPSDPPPPGATPAPAADPTSDMTPGANEWTVSMQGDKCVAISNGGCGHVAAGQPIPPCNPPAPIPYTCIPQVSKDHPITVLQFAGSSTCQLPRAPEHCPPHAHCNPGPPTQVPCPGTPASTPTK